VHVDKEERRGISLKINDRTSLVGECLDYFRHNVRLLPLKLCTLDHALDYIIPLTFSGLRALVYREFINIY